MAKYVVAACDSIHHDAVSRRPGGDYPIREKVRVIGEIMSCPIPARFQENMTVTTRQVMELVHGRCGVRNRYVCSFPRRHGSASGKVAPPPTCRCR